MNRFFIWCNFLKDKPRNMSSSGSDSLKRNVLGHYFLPDMGGGLLYYVGDLSLRNWGFFTLLVDWLIDKCLRFWTDLGKANETTGEKAKPRVILITEFMSSGSLKKFLLKTKKFNKKIPLQSWRRWCTQVKGQGGGPGGALEYIDKEYICTWVQVESGRCRF